MKCLVSVIMRTEAEGGRNHDAFCRAKGVPGPHYRPQFQIIGSSNGPIDMQFTEEIRLVRGERFVTEIESIFEGADYSEFKTGKKFVICEGSRVVGDGRILATSPPTKED